MNIYPIANTSKWGLFYKKELNEITSQNKIDKYWWFLSFWKQNTKEIILDIFKDLWIKLDDKFIKDLSSVSFQIRKKIKDEQKELIEILDNPNFLIPYAYLLSWFNTHSQCFVSQNNTNSIDDFSETIKILLNTNKIITKSFLCAHRENKDIVANELVNNINIYDFHRAENLLLWVLSNTNNNHEINFFNMQWNKIGVMWVFPNIFIKYLLEGRLGELLRQLNNHLHQLQTHSKASQIKPVDEHHKNVEQFLAQRYWSNWWDIDLIDTNKSDPLLHIAYHETMPSMRRVIGALDIFYNNISNKELSKIIKLNQQNSDISSMEIKEIIEIFLNQNITQKSIYETAFYYLWWKETYLNQGIGFGFDRDHDYYQTLSFKAGYNFLQITNWSPLLYAKRTWKRSLDNIREISFRQFWHFNNV